MNRFRITALQLSLVMLGLLSCAEDEYVPAEPPLPPATQVGANTFGCRIDGKVFIPDATGCFAIPPIRALEGYYDATQRFGKPAFFDISAVNCLTSSSVSFTKLGVTTRGLYSFPEPPCTTTVNLCDYANLGIENDGEFQYTAGYVEITRLDTNTRIVSGIFAFDFTNGSKAVKVTDGRFDIKY